MAVYLAANIPDGNVSFWQFGWQCVWMAVYLAGNMSDGNVSDWQFVWLAMCLAGN
jgi:hypothetical protein